MADQPIGGDRLRIELQRQLGIGRDDRARAGERFEQRPIELPGRAGRPRFAAQVLRPFDEHRIEHFTLAHIEHIQPHARVAGRDQQLPELIERRRGQLGLAVGDEHQPPGGAGRERIGHGQRHGRLQTGGQVRSAARRQTRDELANRGGIVARGQFDLMHDLFVEHDQRQAVARAELIEQTVQPALQHLEPAAAVHALRQVDRQHQVRFALGALGQLAGLHADLQQLRAGGPKGDGPAHVRIAARPAGAGAKR